MKIKKNPKGILLVNKPAGNTSFSLIKALRRKLSEKKIGHAGTLDPFATGVMILLVGKEYTKKSDTYLNDNKEYTCTIKLGEETDSYDCDGKVTATSSTVPTLKEVQEAFAHFQGEIEQIPPMFSAKKIQGKKLYELARAGKEVERAPVKIQLNSTFLEYNYPYIKAHIRCSKGTYIRSIAYDLGKILHCGAHLSELCRIKSGEHSLEECIDGELLFDSETDITPHILHSHLERA